MELQYIILLLSLVQRGVITSVTVFKNSVTIRIKNNCPCVLSRTVI